MALSAVSGALSTAGAATSESGATGAGTSEPGATGVTGFGSAALPDLPALE